MAMQSTPNTANFRPKVGRPPAAIAASSPQQKQAAPKAPATSNALHQLHLDSRLLLVSVTVVLGITLVLSWMVVPAMHSGDIEIPAIPALVSSLEPGSDLLPEKHGIASDDGKVVGTLSELTSDSRTVTYSSEKAAEKAELSPSAGSTETAAIQPSAPQIDKSDRERLLSILSKD